MATNYQTVDINVVGNKMVVTKTDLPTTPLAEVDFATSADTFLAVKNGVVVQVTPDDIPYDNTGSGLTATDIGGAIDELASDKLEADTNGDLTLTGGITASYARINSVACKVFSGLPSWTGSSVSAPTGYSGYGRCFMYGLGEADKYFFLIDSASAMWVGRAVNNAASITWRPINYIKTADNWTENGITYKAWRAGDIVQLSALGGTLTSNVAAESFLTTVPNGYRPTTYSVEGWETSAGHRILVNTNGQIGCFTAYSSGAPIRFTVTYIGQQ